MQIDIQKIKDRIFSNEAVRLKIARDFGLTCIASEADGFAADVLHHLGQKPSSSPLDQEHTNSEVFRAAVRALGSNQRKWADYLGNEARITEALCGFNPVEAVQNASVDELKRWLPGQTSSADAKAIMEWAKLLANTDCYYQSVKHLGRAFRALSFDLYHDELTDTNLLQCLVGFLGNPPSRWAGLQYLDSGSRDFPYSHWKANGMGYVLTSEFLRNLGWNGFKPDRHIQRLFDRWLPGHRTVVQPTAQRLQSLIGRNAKSLNTYLTYSQIGVDVAPKELSLSQVDNLVWLLGAYLERKGWESSDNFLIDVSAT